MKAQLIVLIGLTLALAAQAEDKRSELKAGKPGTATLTITTEDRDGIQGAVYADGLELQAFIEMLLKNPHSELAALKRKIEKRECGADARNQADLDLCGAVEISSPVKVSFNRDGWVKGEADYMIFVGFRERSTGHTLSMRYMVRISETAEAQINADGQYLGTVNKVLKLGKTYSFPRN